ncbi:MAG: TlpA family protein disulfide reductase [Prolixibacteraceae bacterium]
MRWYLVLFFLLYLSEGKAQSLNYEIKNTDNNWVNLKDLSGEKLTVLDFWATWCKPCVNALPKLSKLYDQFESQGVNFIGVNVDGPRNQAKVKPFSQSIGITYPVVFDSDQELLSEMNASVLPTLIILNAKGKEVFRHEGFQPGDEKLIEETLNSLLNK